MLGWTIETWDSIAYWTLFAGAVLGGLAVALTAFSSWVTIKTSGIVQREADQRIAEAKARGDEAHKEASTAQAEAEKIRKQNLELSIALEKEKAERLKLEGKLSSRHLTPEQSRAISVSLLRESGKKIISVTKLGDKEASEFADDLIQAFEKGGASVIVNYAGVISPPVYGLLVAPRSDTYLSRAMDAAQLNYDRTDGVSFVFVGLKPPPL